MTKDINILLTYDTYYPDETLTEDLLEQLENYHCTKVYSFIELSRKLKEQELDIILLDLSQSQVSRIAALISIEFEAKDIPVIVISGDEDEEFALQLVKQGAQDHLGSDCLCLTNLKKSINLAIERKQLQNRLEFYMDSFEASNKELENFAYVASHDLQEPLRKIITFGDRLTSKCTEQLDDKAQDYLGRMQGAASRMKILLNDLLQYSRASRQAEEEVIDLNQLVKEIIDSLDDVIQEKQAQISYDDLPNIEANHTQIQQVFQNLISNAIKYSKEAEAPQVKIEYKRDKDQHVISFSDNGIGFSNEYAKKIFNQFYRLHGKNSQYQGTGMGLAICKKIIERGGGSIAATSEEGQGSTFIIRLPAKELVTT